MLRCDNEVSALLTTLPETLCFIREHVYGLGNQLRDNYVDKPIKLLLTGPVAISSHNFVLFKPDCVVIPDCKISI